MLKPRFGSPSKLPIIPVQHRVLVNNLFKIKNFFMAAAAMTTFAASVEGYAAEAVLRGDFSDNASSWTKSIYYNNFNLNPSPYALLTNVSGQDTYGNTFASKNIYTIDMARGWCEGGCITSNGIYQKIVLAANTQYKLTFKARVETTGSSDLFVSIRKPDQSPSYVDGSTVVEKRVLVSSTGLATYTFYFKTPEVLTDDDTYLNFAGASGAVLGGQRTKIGITDVSLTDNPTFTQNVNYYMTASSQVSIDINQLGYLGKDKPLIFTVRGYSVNWDTNLTPYLYRNGVKVTNVPAATLVQSAIDPETKEKVLTFSMNVSSLSAPVNDSQTDQTYGMRAQGYQIGLDSSAYYKPSFILSKPFQINPSLYNNLAVDALNYFKANHANEQIVAVPGKAVHSRGESGSVKYDGVTPKSYHNAREAGPAGDAIATCRGGLDNFGNDFTSTPCTFPNGATFLNVQKGWFDAGDQGKYVVNGGVALWTLQNQIERIQSGLSTPVNSTQLNKLLDEARYEMDFMLSMQAPIGTTAVVPVGWQGSLYTPPVPATGTTPAKPFKPGVYQVPLGDKQTIDNRLANDVTGAVSYNGGRLPRLQIKLNLTSNEDVGGMVFHSVYDEIWTIIPTAPEKNTEKRLLSYPTSAATFNFAAVAAQCSRIFKSVDSVYAQKCSNAAKLAWNTAIARRDVKKDIYRYEYSNNGWSAVDTGPNYLVLENGFGLLPQWSGGGAYGDVRFKDEVYWAAMELYLATNDSSYLAKLTREFVGDNDFASAQYSKCEAVSGSTNAQKDFPAYCYSWANGFDWQNVMALGTISALSVDTTSFPAGAVFKTTEPNGSTASTSFSIGTLQYTNSPRKNLLQLADALVGQTNSQAFRFPKAVYDGSRNTEYDWGSNGSVLNRALILGVAFDLTANKAYGNAAVSAMDYILGRNANSISYVTGYGNRPAQYPHHRYWAKLANNAYPEAQPGALLGGPNSRDIQSIFANADHCTKRDKAPSFKCLGTFDPATVGQGDGDNKYFIETVAASCLAAKAPQKCFADSHRSFASSEVAINWNAPLTWMATFLSNYGYK